MYCQRRAELTRTPPYIASRGVFVVDADSGWQSDPRVPAAVVNRILRRWEFGIGKGADRDADGGWLAAFFGMEHRTAADRAETKTESAAVVAGAHEFGCVTGNSVRRSERGQRSEHAACSLLAGQAVADADAERFVLNFNLQLAAEAGSGSGTHSIPLM